MLSGMSAMPPQSDEEIAQLLGLIPPQRVLGWAQDGPDESSVAAVVDISGSGYLETWAAGGGITMSGLGAGLYGTVAFAANRADHEDSVLRTEVWNGTARLCVGTARPNTHGFVVWTRDLYRHGEWPRDAADGRGLTIVVRWIRDER